MTIQPPFAYYGGKTTLAQTIADPTGTGRYCPPRICWCGDCAWYVPMPEPDYTRLREAAERVAAKQRRSWESRDDGTWIDQL